MKKILEGVVKFRKNDYEVHKELFKEMGNSQNPHTLLITCSDSRVVPAMITQTLPGELFIVRNIANLVPPYRSSADFFSTTSAIEYAVKILEVDSIVVCGHSNCGGCMALYAEDEVLDKLPHTRKWLQLAQSVKDKALNCVGSEDPAALEWMTEQINIVEQMMHLFTYPYVEERYKNGTLNIIGMYYIIETGEVYSYNKEIGEFEIIN